MVETEVTCNGKSLLTGGYLILSELYSGISLSLPVSFKSNCKLQIDENKFITYIKNNIDTNNKLEVEIENENENEKEKYLDKNLITVIEFDIFSKNYDTKYKAIIIITINEETSVQEKHQNHNLSIKLKTRTHDKFIDAILLTTISIFFTRNLINIDKLSNKHFLLYIELVADPIFYSFELDSGLISNNYNAKSKTGLGSSSALISSLSSTIYYTFCKYFEFNCNRSEMCLVSLYCNWIISEKISSGYDIITNYVGNNYFTKPNNTIYKSLEETSFYQEITSILVKNLSSSYKIKPEIKDIIDSMFDIFDNYFSNIKKLYLRQSVNIYLFKRSNEFKFKSTDSRIESKNVLKYLEIHERFNNDYIKEINLINEKIYDYLSKYIFSLNLSEDLILDKLESQTNDSSSILLNLKEENLNLIKKLRNLSILTKVDIIPEDTIEFLSEILNLNSCIFCIIPGAGGFDAIITIFNKENEKVDSNDSKLQKSDEDCNLFVHKICEKYKYVYKSLQYEVNSEYSLLLK